MPWNEVNTMSLRREFVTLASVPGTNIRELCCRFRISRKTAYKWIGRYREEGEEGLRDRSRRPGRSPGRTSAEMEALILNCREAHRAYGGRKIRRVLLREGNRKVPSASTITEILRRQGKVDADESVKHQPMTRYEYEEPNGLWQMDFKGHFETPEGRCNPLTILDDHSRFLVGLFACENQKGITVQRCLVEVFRRYGMPERILVDNGSPWGDDREHPYTPLTVWWIRLGIRPIHGRPYHPQTQGKAERFHRTLSAEVLRYERFRDLEDCQRRFTQWRESYNGDRPHEALGMEVPTSRYRVSQRSYPETLPPIEYGPGDRVRQVNDGGRIHFRGKVFRVGQAFDGYPVALRPTGTEEVFEVYFCQVCIRTLHLQTDAGV